MEVVTVKRQPDEQDEYAKLEENSELATLFEAAETEDDEEDADEEEDEEEE